MQEVILLAKRSPKGQIDVVFSHTDLPHKAKAADVIKNSSMIVSVFNTIERDGLMFRTVIVIDATWSDNYKVYQTQYGLDNSHLMPYEELLEKK